MRPVIMKPYYLYLLFFVILSCQTKEEKERKILTAEDFSAKIQSTPNAIVLDVRREEELVSGVIPNAINIVYGPEFTNGLSALPKERPIFVYCASGIRSGKAAKILRDNGYSPVYELEGGLRPWVEKGLPLQPIQQ